MTRDKKGFVYPSVDAAKCIECGLCKQVCPSVIKNDRNFCLDAYAYKRAGVSKRMRSQSGGAFASLAEYLLKNNERVSVFGVALDSELRAVYKRVTKVSELNRLLGSKYVQADTAGMQELVVEDLKNGYTSLVCGTPCFVDAVKRYVISCGVASDKLILVDLICHGVMGPVMYKDYIEWLQEETGLKVIDFKFRDKRIGGWGGVWSVAECKKGVSLATKAFLDAFHRDAFHRDACYTCAHNSYSRCSDITIGDFWEIGKYNKDFYDSLGVSCVLAGTEKGNKLILESLSGKGHLRKTPIEDTKQRPLVDHLKRDEKEEERWNTYFCQGVKGIVEDATIIKFWKRIPLTANKKFLWRYFLSMVKNSRLGMIIRRMRRYTD